MGWHDLADLLHALILLVLLFGSFGIGALVQRRLPETRRGPKTHEMLRVVMDMLVTFAAIVLGLLITSAKTDFDATGGDVRTYAIEIITLDQSLADYGPETTPLRGELVHYTRNVLGDIASSGIGAATGRRFGLMSQIQTGLLRLDPASSLQGHLRDEALSQLDQLQQQRHRLGDEAEAQTSVSFYAVLSVWLMVVYGCFGLITEHSWLGTLIVGLSVLAIVLAVFVILDMATPFTGLVVISDQPLRDALATITTE